MVDAAAWGVEPGYHAYNGEWIDAPRQTVDALLRAMGADGERPADVPDLAFARPGGTIEGVTGPAEVLTEDGGSFRIEGGSLPPDAPLGYHRLRPDDADNDAERTLIVSPGRCYLPRDMKTWGWAVQLYAARSESSWGIGDLGDLARLAEWASGSGAGLILLNPLHASLPTVQTASPYFPSSRCFRNPLYLRAEGEQPPEAKSLNADRVIDRDAVWRLKLPALEAAFNAFGQQAAPTDFERFLCDGGEVLRGYATFCAISEVHGVPWQDWPDELRRPDSPAVDQFAADPRNAERIRFHQWLQWQVERQLGEAGRHLDLMQDIAIGCDPAGADSWLWQDAFATGVRVGAPPDEFNTQGQDWGLPPFNPWRLRQLHYEPFIHLVRNGFRHAGGIRFDHVMGLFRLYWIPPETGARNGTYVRYPHHELLDILALESVRANAYVVGEDLGTVEDLCREEMTSRDILSYRLLWFEPNPPQQFPERALAAVTTHDLPTIAGMWSASDLAEQERLGLEPNVESTKAIHERLQAWLDLSEDAPVEDVIVAAHGLLGEAPSHIVTATLDDAIGVEERPNIPGTTDERPNWSLALPKTIEEIETDPLVARVAHAIKDRRGTPG